MDDVGFSTALCRTLNDARAEYASYAPDRLKLVAKLPMIEPKAAAEELERCVTEHGFVGMVTATHIREKNLDDPRFDVVWENAQRLGGAVSSHASPALHGPGATQFQGRICLGDLFDAHLHHQLAHRVFDAIPLTRGAGRKDHVGTVTFLQ